MLRRRVRGGELAEVKADEAQGRQTLLFADQTDDIKLWEYQVLVSNTDHTLVVTGQMLIGSSCWEFKPLLDAIALTNG